MALTKKMKWANVVTFGRPEKLRRRVRLSLKQAARRRRYGQ